jgi:BlaI family transcriptional regulator, penicillinase repressor
MMLKNLRPGKAAGAKAHQQLSRRERQIMDVLFRAGRASAADVLAAISDPPSYSAVRAHLRTLEEKGHARHEAEDLRYVYIPTMRQEQARDSALAHLVETFFGGSVAQAATALLDPGSARLTTEELDRLARLIDEARKEGR